MLTLLDRTIIRSFLMNFVILLAVLMSLFVLIDLIADLDEFTRGGLERARSPKITAFAEEFGFDEDKLRRLKRNNASIDTLSDELRIDQATAERIDDELSLSLIGRVGWISYVILEYYTPTLLMVYVFFNGLIIVAAMGFTLAQMHRHRELTAIVASGVSLYRVAAPLLVCGFLLGALTLPVREMLIPDMADRMTKPKSQVRYETVRSNALYFTPDDRGALVSARSFELDPQDGAATLLGVRVLQRDPDTGRLIRRISANSAYWDPDVGQWRLIQGIGVRPRLEGEAGESLGLPELEEVTWLATGLNPEVLLARRAELYVRLLSMQQLRELQANPAVEPGMRAQITQSIWSRFSLLVLNMLVLVLGLPFFLLRGPANTVGQAVKATGLCLGVWAGGLVLLQSDPGQLPPVVSAWLPVVIVLPLASWGLSRIRS